MRKWKNGKNKAFNRFNADSRLARRALAFWPLDDGPADE
jgi:hypothetical protein